jgi:gamma-glutamyltranspeptidase/glutathione hydrolase
MDSYLEPRINQSVPNNCYCFVATAQWSRISFRRENNVKKLLSLLLCAAIVFQPAALLAQSSESAVIRYNSRHHPVVDTDGMVASQNAVASAVGAQILAVGGNAVDAAVGVGFALAVVLPRAGNIGGGGFMLAYLADQDEVVAIDYREMAPPRATRDMFLDSAGDVDPTRSKFSH